MKVSNVLLLAAGAYVAYKLFTNKSSERVRLVWNDKLQKYVRPREEYSLREPNNNGGLTYADYLKMQNGGAAAEEEITLHTTEEIVPRIPTNGNLHIRK